MVSEVEGENPFRRYGRITLLPFYIGQLDEIGRHTKLNRDQLNENFETAYSVYVADHGRNDLERRQAAREVYDLLKSHGELPKLSQSILDDWIDRRCATGRPRTPSDQITKAELRIRKAVSVVDEQVRRGTRPTDAIQAEAERSGIGIKKLTNAVNGRRGSSRRLHNLE